jgi:hypothetical protein
VSLWPALAAQIQIPEPSPSTSSCIIIVNYRVCVTITQGVSCYWNPTNMFVMKIPFITCSRLVWLESVFWWCASPCHSANTGI